MSIVSKKASVTQLYIKRVNMQLVPNPLGGSPVHIVLSPTTGKAKLSDKVFLLYAFTLIKREKKH